MLRNLGLALSLVLAPARLHGGDAKLTYPSTKRVEHYDTYHGVKVHCPYRWLEDDARTSKEVAAWIETQAKFTEGYLKTIPQRASIKKRLTELWNYERYGDPVKVAKRYYVFTKNDGLQNQAVYYKQDSLDGEASVLLDPNKWSKDGTISLQDIAFSKEGKHVAYALSESGSDWSVIRVMDVDARKQCDDELRWVKFSGIAWTHDNQGFFYSRYPEPKKGQKFLDTPVDQRLYYHKLGTAQKEDTLVYEYPKEPSYGIGAGVSDDGRYLAIYLNDGTTSDKSKILIKDLSKPGNKIQPLIDDFESADSGIDNIGTTFYFRTDYRAPRGRIVAIDLNKPGRADWKQIVPEVESTLEEAHLTGEHLVVRYLKDARSDIKIFDLKGKFVRNVKLPGIASVDGFVGRRDESETFYGVTGFATPRRIYRYNVKTGESTLLREPNVRFKPDDFETVQVFFAGKDGTKIPMFISYKKGIKLDRDNPTILYGYGGFNESLTPSFDMSKLVWMEMGGVYAQANIRGGGEYGRDWHRAAVKLKRQVAFDDFIAAAEWLIASKYTRPARLAIEGSSNGGLLVGACLARQPELFGAALPDVGVMDMLRFHKFTAGTFWVDEYGSVEDPKEFKALFAYSPYHNLKKGTKYPATLVTTADTDDRVVPSHSFKFIAQLQHCQGGAAPVLARIETNTGHGAGRILSKDIEEVADRLAFLARALQMK